jgi:hypothetical protein
MAEKNFYVDINLNGQELRQASFETLAANPVTNLFDGRMYYDTVTKRVKYYDAGAAEWKTVVRLEDLEQFSTLVGGYDASTNAVPQAGSGDSNAIRQGDRWYITVPGTIAGLSAGSSVLEIGDLLVAIADVAAGAAVPANFIALQTNADMSSAGQVEQVVIASIPANTPTSVGSALTTIYSAQFFGASGEEIGLSFDRTAQEVTSNVALTNVTASMVGI